MSENTKKRAAGALELAKEHLGEGTMPKSAAIGFADAESLFTQGQYQEALDRAYSSLRYSVGLFHPDTEKVHGWLRPCPVCKDLGYVRLNGVERETCSCQLGEGSHD